MDQPIAARLAWWGTAYLRATESEQHCVDALLGDEFAAHTFAEDGSDPVDLVTQLRRLRASGADQIGFAAPAPGVQVGLGGPGPFNLAALEAEQAAVVWQAGVGLVPTVVGAGVQWRVMPAHRRQVPDIGEADRTLRRALVEAATALADLDVAKWRPELADDLMDLRHHDTERAPHGTPTRCIELSSRALRALRIVELAALDDGAAVSSTQIAARTAAIAPLARAGREALVAAHSPEAWPD